MAAESLAEVALLRAQRHAREAFCGVFFFSGKSMEVGISIWNMYGISMCDTMEYVWNIYGISMEYLWNIDFISES